MLQTSVLILSGVAAVLGTVRAMQATRTVPADSVGVLFFFNKQYYYWGRDPNGRLVYTPFVWPGRLLWWMIPGMHRITYVKVNQRSTFEVTIAVQRTPSEVWLSNISLTYDMTLGAVFRALCIQDNYGEQVSTFFLDIVGDVLESQQPSVGRDKIRRLILEEANRCPDLQEYGALPSRVKMRELSQAPMTQVTAFLEKLIGDGEVVIARGADIERIVSESITRMEEALSRA